MKVIFLNAPEKNLLENYVKTSSVALIRFKAHAVLMKSQDFSLEQISLVVFRDKDVVSRWINAFQKSRMSSIFSGHVNNENASKLTKEQKEEIKKIVGLEPDEYGIPKEFWDVPKLKNYVKAEFGVVYESDISYHFLLKFSGLSFKYPDERSPRRNEELIKKRVEEIRTEIKPMLSDPNWLVFTSDETRLQKDAEIRKAWLKKGVRTIVKTERSNEHQNYIGFLNQKNNLCQLFEIQRGNSKETIRVLKKLVKQYPDKKICIIWDNARWHRSKELREQLSKGKSLENIHLIALPPYAPDHNPIEHVWNYAKSKIANKVDNLFEDTKNKFTSLINNNVFLYHF